MDHEYLVLDQRPEVMRRVQRRERPALDFCISSSDEDDPGDAATAIFRINDNSSLSPNDSAMGRLSLLPAFPSLHRHGTSLDRGGDHLLLANVPHERLTTEQRLARQRGIFHLPYTLTEHRHAAPFIPSLFLDAHRQWYDDLARRLRIDESILDYNYPRLLKCMDIMKHERIQYRFADPTIAGGEPLPISEYAVALEFYLQIDVDLFYMKTCSFRGARASSAAHLGLFCDDEPQALYGLIRCNRRTCAFCYPNAHIATTRRPPVVQFSVAQKHRFVSGYEAILNCPTSCQTNNIIYALTCPCGQFDYVGYTSVTLSRRLFYHRQHGQRIMREFILGAENVRKLDQRPKTYEDLIKDGMLLYRHSARCPKAVQWFLDCNPNFWPFVPMCREDADQDNAHYQLPASVPMDPTSPLITASLTRSDLDAGTYMSNLPPLPDDRFTFSTRQCVEQFQILKDERNRLEPDTHLDLYNATIIAVMPEHCSGPLQRIVEALFITHARTQLNTAGHLDGSVEKGPVNPRGVTESTRLADRGDWCRDLIRPTSVTF